MTLTRMDILRCTDLGCTSSSSERLPTIHRIRTYANSTTPLVSVDLRNELIKIWKNSEFHLLSPEYNGRKVLARLRHRVQPKFGRRAF